MGTAVLGAGPAGLTAAYVLGLRGVPAAVYEADGTVGGIAKTVEYNGYRFDLGGHRFFTKFAQVQRLWEEVLGERPARPAAPLAHLLQRQVPRVPAPGARRHSAAGLLRIGSVCAVVSQQPPLAVPPRDRDVRGLRHRQLRQPHLRRVLPLVHGEGVGRARLGDPRRVGRAADQGLLVLEGPARGAAPDSWEADDADRGVPLPAPRPRADVGGVRGPRGRARHPRSPPSPRADDPPRPQRRRRSDDGARRADDRSAGRRRAVEHRAQRARADPRPRSTSGDRRGRASACATARCAW